MRASDYRCVFLGRPADHLHHSSGRDVAGNYLDSRLIVPVVRRQHVVEHQGWNVAGIGDGTSSDPNALRLRRNAHLLIRLTDHHEDGSVPLPVLYFRELAFMLIRVADDMEGER